MFLGENCMFLGEKCIFFGENAWISENQEGFALENALNFRIYIKNAITFESKDRCACFE